MTQPVSYPQGPLESHSKLVIFSALLGQHAEWRKILFLLSILNLQSCFTRSMLRYTLDYMNRRVNLKKKWEQRFDTKSYKENEKHKI